jgi:ATP-binding cassette subfamily C (CFTR/MRP) protein 1
MILTSLESGKSSLLLTLLGFLELRSGAIYIDGVDISTVPRDTLRSRITTVPQDPFFPGTRSIRLNLKGSTSSLPDADLIAALDKVGLLPHLITSLRPGSKPQPARAVNDDLNEIEISQFLDSEMSKLPLSPGQLQLFCLARALLHENKIVLLDEVTSAVDHATEEKLRAVLREGIRGKTVILIAHREEMIRQCDVMVTVDAGSIVKVEPAQ